MKTNQVMTRTIGNFSVYQRTSDGMFDATTLLKQWNQFSGERKGVDEFFRKDTTNVFLNELAKQENLKTTQLVIKKRGRYGDTWVHPLVFIDFAMWLNPAFKVQVLKFVYDQLILFRHEAGDSYPAFTNAISKFHDVRYWEVAQGLNYIVFGYHKKDMRNEATQEQLKELIDVQKKLAFACEMGYITTYNKLINEMERMANNQKLISKKQQK